MMVSRLVPQPGRRLAREVYTGIAKIAAPWRPLPEYLVIGAARAGSTSLYEYLIRHPAVLPALVKEVHYFTASYHRGEAWYRAHFPTVVMRRLVDMRHGISITGEATPYYLFHPSAAARVHALLPNAKLLVVLRDPVLRAVSHYQHERRLGVEPLSMDAAIDREAERLDPGESSEAERLERDAAYAFRYQHFGYLARGRYAEQIERFQTLFSPAQLMVIRSEDLFEHPDTVYRAATRFLGLPDRSLRDYRRFNASKGMSLDGRLEARLREYFVPHNARLERLLDRAMGWQG